MCLARRYRSESRAFVTDGFCTPASRCYTVTSIAANWDVMSGQYGRGPAFEDSTEGKSAGLRM